MKPRGMKRRLLKAVQRRAPWAKPVILWLRMLSYGARARFRRHLCKKFIGVTGSCGKSTVTFLATELLKNEGSVLPATKKNLPRETLMRLMSLRHPVDFLVQEMSGHLPNAIGSVVGVAKPDVAVVTAIGLDHFSSFKGLVVKGEGETPVDQRYLAVIAAEKGKLVSGLNPRGVACLNADDPHVRAMSSLAPGRVIYFGTSDDADLRAENVRAKWPERLNFDLVVAGTSRHVKTRFVGISALPSILASLAVVHAVGGDLGTAVAELAKVEPVDKRMSVRQGADGHTYLDDSHKAPQWQVDRLLTELPTLGAKPLVFILGEVSDTRNDKSTVYRKLLRRASGIADHVIGFGPAASNARKISAEGHNNVHAMDTLDEIVAFLAKLPPSLVLLKSAESTKMYRVWRTAAETGLEPPNALRDEKPQSGRTKKRKASERDLRRD